ncbi:VTT domain-containing protein [Clostridium intestinale]|uniref:TVP38/TMEM64 family protein n=1 Tax=Clostridium intestinale TaxID=36845 RepID=UPI0028E9C468|nr:VTT domain-containing protein [Clostridium intestinale]
MEKTKKILLGKIALIILGIIVVILAFRYLPQLIELTTSLDKFRDYIISTGKFGAFLVIFFQIVQTVIAPIPGEAIQLAGGYVYGVPLGLLYSVIGMMIGSVMIFYFTRFIGASYVEKRIDKEKYKWLFDIMDSKKFTVTLFVFFIIPGLPKDFLIYLAGLTPIKPIKFFVILLVGRLPSIAAPVVIGANIHYENYTSIIVISIIAVVLFILGMVYKDKIIEKLSGTEAEEV